MFGVAAATCILFKFVFKYSVKLTLTLLQFYLNLFLVHVGPVWAGLPMNLRSMT